MNLPTRKKSRALNHICAGLVLMLAAGTAAFAQQAKRPPASAGEEFFIISSVDPGKNHIVLKRPTEVTVLVSIDAKTTCVNEKGKPVKVYDLRAGDTVFVTTRRNDQGDLLAIHIRMGYMTLQEVHRRYLDSSLD
jgi:hypothetical protein